MMYVLETLDQGKWNTVLRSSRIGIVKAIMKRLEDSGCTCRII